MHKTISPETMPHKRRSLPSTITLILFISFALAFAVSLTSLGLSLLALRSPALRDSLSTVSPFPLSVALWTVLFTSAGLIFKRLSASKEQPLPQLLRSSSAAAAARTEATKQPTEEAPTPCGPPSLEESQAELKKLREEERMLQERLTAAEEEKSRTEDEEVEKKRMMDNVTKLLRSEQDRRQEQSCHAVQPAAPKADAALPAAAAAAAPEGDAGVESSSSQDRTLADDSQTTEAAEGEADIEEAYRTLHLPAGVPPQFVERVAGLLNTRVSLKKIAEDMEAASAQITAKEEQLVALEKERLELKASQERVEAEICQQWDQGLKDVREGSELIVRELEAAIKEHLRILKSIPKQP